MINNLVLNPNIYVIWKVENLVKLLKLEISKKIKNHRRINNVMRIIIIIITIIIK